MIIKGNQGRMHDVILFSVIEYRLQKKCKESVKNIMKNH